MYVVYLTGGLASGKSTVSAWLAEKGATIFDLDVIAREEQEAEPVLEELKKAFGADVVGADGKIVRSLLAERAFVSAEATQMLNEICWPPVIKRVSDYIADGKKHPDDYPELVVFEIPLLVEAAEQAPGLMELADEIITISAPEDIRLERAVARGMSREDAERRIARQTTDKEREMIANTVLENASDQDSLKMILLDWFEQRLTKSR